MCARALAFIHLFCYFNFPICCQAAKCFWFVCLNRACTLSLITATFFAQYANINQQRCIMLKTFDLGAKPLFLFVHSRGRRRHSAVESLAQHMHIITFTFLLFNIPSCLQYIFTHLFRPRTTRTWWRHTAAGQLFGTTVVTLYVQFWYGKPSSIFHRLCAPKPLAHCVTHSHTLSKTDATASMSFCSGRQKTKQKRVCRSTDDSALEFF